MSVDPIYITPEELSERLAGVVSVGTLANWRGRTPNSGPAFLRIGSRVLYPMAEVIAWEKRNTVASTKEESNGHDS